MADIAASVLTRLKNKAQASGRSYQLCLQLFCQEEFSIRLLNLTAELQSMLIFASTNAKHSRATASCA